MISLETAQSCYDVIRQLPATSSAQSAKLTFMLKELEEFIKSELPKDATPEE